MKRKRLRPQDMSPKSRRSPAEERERGRGVLENDRDEHISGNRGRARKFLSDDNEVGYAKPPKAHQFKPGQSGNPKGRAKGRKNEATILDEILSQKITVSERGRERKITVLDGIMRRFAEEALRGNIKAAGFILARYSATSNGEVPQDAGLSEDDQAVLSAYANELLAASGPKNGGKL